MKNSISWLPAVKSFLPLYFEFEVFLATVALVALEVDHDYFAKVLDNYWWIALAVLFLPLLVLALSIGQGVVAKWVRLLSFMLFRADVFALAGLIVLIPLTVLLIRETIMHASQGGLWSLNILIVDLFFMFLLGLVLAGRFQVRQPSALLLRKHGDDKIYLYQDRVIEHIPDPPTLMLLGYSFDEVVEVSEREFEAYTPGVVIESVRTARLLHLEGNQSKTVWMICGDEKRAIPDPVTLNYILGLGLKERQPEERASKPVG